MKYGIVILAAVAFTAKAALIQPLGVNYAANNADAIIVGSAHGAFSAGPVPGATSFSLTVVRSIQGNLPPGDITVNFYGRISYAGGGRASTGDEAFGNGLWFLKRGHGGWDIISPTNGGGLGMAYYPTLLSVPTIHPYAANAPVADKLASELAEAYEKGNPWISMSGYDSIKSPVVSQSLNNLAASPEIDKQMFALAAQLRQGDINTLASAVSLSPGWVGSTSSRQHQPMLLVIREQWRSTDPTSVSLLGRAATDTTNPNTFFRIIVAHALAAIHSKDALPYLATLMDDQSADIRAEAIGGIASFALGHPVHTTAGLPSMSNMQPSGPYVNTDTIRHFTLSPKTIAANEGYYRTFWKNWWAQNKASVGY